MNDLIKFDIDDIPERAAYDAHRGTSFVPDERAASERREYVGYMAAVAAEFAPWATPENANALRADLEQFRAGYVTRKLALLAARARIVSTMITGGSGWTAAMVRRNERANETADKRRGELLEYVDKALSRLRRQYNPALVESAPIRQADGDAVARLTEKVAEAEALQERMKAANAIIRKKLTDAEKIAALVAVGFAEDAAAALLTPDCFGALGFPHYSLTNNNANIRRMKQRLAGLTVEAARREVLPAEYEIGGVRVVENAEAERLQILFDGKPPAEMIAKLKRRGFHWKRDAGAWQRLLNNAARQAAREVLG